MRFALFNFHMHTFSCHFLNFWDDLYRSSLLQINQSATRSRNFVCLPGLREFCGPVMLSYDSTSRALNGIRCYENLNFLFQLCVLFVSHTLIRAFMFYHFQNVVPEFKWFLSLLHKLPPFWLIELKAIHCSNSLWTDAPLPSVKIRERDIRELPSLIMSLFPRNVGESLWLVVMLMPYHICIRLLVFRLSGMGMWSKTTKVCCTGCRCICSLPAAIVNKREGCTEFNA